MSKNTASVVHVSSVHKVGDIRIFHKECKTLAEAGYAVTFVIPADRDDVIDAITIKALPPVTGRFQRMTKRVWLAYKLARESGAAICHLHDPELIPMGLFLRLEGKRIIYDSHEDLVDDVLTKEWIPTILRTVTAWCVRVLLKLAGMLFNGVVAATPKIAQRYPKRKTIVVHNYPFPNEFAAPQPRPFADRKRTILYIGSISRIRGVTQMVNAVSQVPNSRLVMVGQFETQELCDEISSLPSWRQVDYTPWQPRDRLRGVLSEARVGLVLFHPERSHLDALPTKLFEYMAVGLPVVASDFPLWREIVGGAECGILVDPLDVESIANAITSLVDDPTLAEELGARGRAAVLSRYNWYSQAGTLLALYGRVAGGQISSPSESQALMGG